MSLPDRFMSRVFPVTESGCWIWMGSLNHDGYGWFFEKGRGTCGAHRYAWTKLNGPLPRETHVCHTCDIRCCVNPDHLFVGTHTDNMRDAAKKGRIKLPRVKLTLQDTQDIVCSDLPAKVLAARYGVTQSHVYGLRQRSGRPLRPYKKGAAL